MQANKDNQVRIKENEKDRYHVEFTRHVKSGRKTKPMTRLQIFNARDFQQIQSVIDKQGIDVLGWHEMRIVHDPVLQARLDQEKADKEAKAEAAAIAKEKAAEAKAAAEPKVKGRPPLSN